MPAAPIPLYIDIVNKVIYNGLTGISTSIPIGLPNGNYTFPPFYFGDSITYNIFLMQPVSASSPGVAPKFQIISATNFFGLEMALGTVDDTYTDLTWQNTWAQVQDPVSGFYYYTAQFSIYTSEIQTALGDSASISTNLNITLLDHDASGNVVFKTIFQSTLDGVQINQVVQNPGTANPLPSPANQYLTSSQISQIYMRKIGLAGDFLTVSSPNGTYSRLFGIDNSGQPFD